VLLRAAPFFACGVPNKLFLLENCCAYETVDTTTSGLSPNQALSDDAFVA
jgi:hypothetical protein